MSWVDEVILVLGHGGQNSGEVDTGRPSGHQQHYKEGMMTSIQQGLKG
jgi:hypothetical protein